VARPVSHLNPWLIEVFTKPIAEICLLFAILMTFFFMFRGSYWCYLFASVAAMIRYEGAALILAAFVMDMIYRKSKKEKVYAFCYSVLASIPLALWMLETILDWPSEDRGNIHYLQY
jgi:small neutral amino acid transporter SnatA (MarC family)